MSTELVYLLMAIVPTVILLIMLLAGGGQDADVEAEADLDTDIGAADVGDTGGPGLISLRLILAFLAGCGVGGGLAGYLKWPIHHMLAALIGGVVLYTAIYQILKLLYRLQANTQVRSSSVVGTTGLVTSAIARGAVGEIKAEDPRTGKSIYLRAQASKAAREFTKGSEVAIKSVLGGLAKVDKP